MQPINSPRRLDVTLLRLADCLVADVARLEDLRRELIELRGHGANWVDGGPVNPETAPRLAEVRHLATRLEQVIDWLESRNDPAVGTTSWEALQARTGPPTVPGALLDATEPVGDRWWLPSLMLFANANSALSREARALVTQWIGVRSQLSHLVVDEIIDGMAGLSVSPWPVLDDAARLRFPTHWLTELAVPVDQLQQIVDASRGRFADLGLTTTELADRPIDLGDVFAAEITVPSRKRARVRQDVRSLAETDDGIPYLTDAPWPAQLLAVAGVWFEESDDPTVRVRAGILSIDTDQGPVRVAGPMVNGQRLPVVDITWDSREQAKLAFAAANQAGGSFSGLVRRVDQQLRTDLAKVANDAS